MVNPGRRSVLAHGHQSLCPGLPHFAPVGLGLVVHEVGNVTAAQLMFGQVVREQVVRHAS